MTAFDSNFIFLDKPDGSVENLTAMKAAGFGGVFCNIHDYDPGLWMLIRNRAADQGMFCGPWARIDPLGQSFKVENIQNLIDVAHNWGQPYVLNAEREIDNTGSNATTVIKNMLGTDDAAIIMEPWLFAGVDWTPVANIPMILEIFPAEADAAKRPADCKGHAHAVGVKCVYFCFGTYGGMQPSDFNLQRPYSIYTGNACGGVFSPWSPTSTGFVACVQEEEPMPDIGSQHGTTALANALRDIMPDKTLLKKDASGKWPPLSSIAATPVSQWKAIDKWERAQSILVEDHDAN